MARDDPKLARFARLLANGRVSIPVAVRHAAGWQVDAPMFIASDEFGVTLRTSRQHTLYVQALYREMMKGKTPLTVDEFIAEKRIEAAREEEEDEARYH